MAKKGKAQGEGHGDDQRRSGRYLSPGVYVEEIDSGTRPIEGVGTSIAAFIGLGGRVPRGAPEATPRAPGRGGRHPRWPAPRLAVRAWRQAQP